VKTALDPTSIAPSGAPPAAAGKFPDVVWRVSWSLAGNILAVSCGDGKVTLWKENLKGVWECEAREASCVSFPSQAKLVKRAKKVPEETNALQLGSAGSHLISLGLDAFPRCQLNIWVDAATSWGIGVIVDKHWAAWKLAPSWREMTASPTINWLETLAIEIAIYIAIFYFDARSAEIQIHGDSLTVLHTFAGSRCKTPTHLDAIRRVHRALEDAHLVLSPIFVCSEHNLADPIS
ncbi:hypothetical protein EWM64_g10925, partial [Hericium alpestre]